MAISSNLTAVTNKNALPPINVLIVGSTGSGKSSLINAVFDSDVVETGAVLPVTKGFSSNSGMAYGLPVVFYDSAGYGYEVLDDFTNPIFRLIEQKASEGKEKEIHLVWFVISAASVRITQLETHILSSLISRQIPVIIVLSKVDLVSLEEKEAISSHLRNFNLGQFDIIAVSAHPILGGQFGLDRLIEKTSDVWSTTFPSLSPQGITVSDSIKISQELLGELEDWKLEAKLEDAEKYFYHTKIVDRILSGERLYVIGRKGTGKTAICEYLVSVDKKHYYSQKLTFKSFPFNLLYSLTDTGYTRPNQYITVWKYFIYSVVCKMLSINPKVDRRSRKKLQKLFNQDLRNALPKALTEWTSFNFELNIIGSGFAVGAGKAEANNETIDIAKRVEALESFLDKNLDSSTYMILFDELDEDYNNAEDTGENNYISLLTSLFKAVQDIRARFENHKIFPIVFLRDDIYDFIQDSDKNKWSDYRVELEWNRIKLKNLLAFRISKAISSNQDILPFLQAWWLAFTQEDIQDEHSDKKNTISIFDYIAQQTYSRPRDFIKYIQICSEIALESNYSKINATTVKLAEKEFSNYLKREIEDELYGIMPEIKRILNIFSKQRSRNLKISEFLDIFQSEIQQNVLSTRDYRSALEILFDFSVIGNVSKRQNNIIFRYENKEAHLNFSEDICVHRGLLKSLQII